jgi:hypothetical protein
MTMNILNMYVFAASLIVTNPSPKRKTYVMSTFKLRLHEVANLQRNK